MVIFGHTVVCLNITFVVSMYAVFIQFQNNNTNLESQTGTEYIQINRGVRSQVETLRTAQTDTQTETHTGRQRDININRHTDRHIVNHRDNTDTHTGRHMDIHINRRMDSNKDRHTYRQT